MSGTELDKPEAEMSRITFDNYLQTAFKNGLFGSDDVVDFLKPLFEEVLSFHQDEKVAPFEWPDKLFITDNRLDIDENYALAPKSNLSALKAIISKDQDAKGVEITETEKYETDVAAGTDSVQDLSLLLDKSENIDRPVYTLGYQCYELSFQHHDELSDIFTLGLILASVSLGLDLNRKEDLISFGNYRRGLYILNQNLHPSLHSLILEMTELNRNKRSNNLYDIIHRLENYRDFDPELTLDLSKVKGMGQQGLNSRSSFILRKLRNRLFDNSRRNRLLYYKTNMRFVNFTITSVPMVVNLRSIRPEHLFTWNKDIATLISAGKDVILNKYLRFSEHPYLTSSLDRIRSEARRDEQEYGFSQLRLAIAFLNWNNFREVADERIQSPLLLVPVELVRTKKVREDTYTLKIVENVAEVNPVISNFLRDQFNIILPDFVELDKVEMQSFYEVIRAQIETAGQGVQLHYTDKPKIKIIHSIARNTVSVFNRRLRKTKSSLNSYKDLDYAYDMEHWKPLGYEIYNRHVKQQATFLEYLINDDIVAEPQRLNSGTEQSRDLFEITSANNPYHWEFDVCNIILGNFNYKKMSLVRDYNEAIDKGISGQVFETLFHDAPKNMDITFSETSAGVLNFENCYHVIEADPTQASAIAKNWSGESYVIQGPPGTGKSQTITNLIADYVALGKRVLFICEKRAALDVVYHRLKQQGLDELCCYIHDSQSDKKQFVLDLKNNYEKFLLRGVDLQRVIAERDDAVRRLQSAIVFLEKYHGIQNTVPDFLGQPVFQFVERLAELDVSLEQHSDSATMELLPDYALWNKYKENLHQFYSALNRITGEDVFSDHPFSKLSETVIHAETPKAFVTNAFENLVLLAEILVAKLSSVFHGFQFQYTLDELIALGPAVDYLSCLQTSENLELIDENSARYTAYKMDLAVIKQMEEHLQLVAEKNVHWRNKLSPQDTDTAKVLASAQETKFFKFLNGNWRRLKSTMSEKYDFDAHAVKPSVLSLLENLQAEHSQQAMLNTAKADMASKYRSHDLDRLDQTIEFVRTNRRLKEFKIILSSPSPHSLIIALLGARKELEQLQTIIPTVIGDKTRTTLSELLDLMENIQSNLDQLPDFLPALRGLTELPESIKLAIITQSETKGSLEKMVALKAFRQMLALDPQFASTDCSGITTQIATIKDLYRNILNLNSDVIRARARMQFQKNLERSALSPTQLDAEGKKFKKRYTEGRKILENEFSKVMRFRSIRDLTASDSGAVIRDLKLIWLMSPLSVSDSITLDTSLFDVVIFDEASQITLEEGIPALFRAKQAIIVGDDKQMPPSNFFNAKSEDPDDLTAEFSDSDDEILSRDADSLLSQGSRKLNNVMLGWHYRSRHETLIGFSNYAFYNAGLLTIPDKVSHEAEASPIVVEEINETTIDIENMLSRSISFHSLPKAVYERRTNESEAKYIALLVAGLLKKGVKESIGIVAFSKEQQICIEDALSELTAADKELERIVEAAYNRVEDDQFVGLFIKNLENVQGDERDIIIMSVCYGFDSKRKMIMNFGPINRKGGEKRLNVIFSRAKKHMAVVSSINHNNITNDYNDGANYFKKFLNYAELVSGGSLHAAADVLKTMVAERQEGIKQRSAVNNVVEGIQRVFEKEGYHVTIPVGQSTFKCTLGIKKTKDDKEYALGILVDDAIHYSNANVLEQYHQRPAILERFGWNVARVFAKDWVMNSTLVIKSLFEQLNLTNNSDFDISRKYESVFTMELLQPGGAPVDQSGTVGNMYSHLEFLRLHYEHENSRKMWEVAVDGNKVVVHWGKIGTKGQYQVKTFASEEQAKAAMQKFMKEKLESGYHKVV